MSNRYLACDLGAESGRVMRGTLADGYLHLHEIHRFANGPVAVGDSLHWNFHNLYRELQTGLQKAGHEGGPITSVSADSWGLDYVLFRADGTWMDPVYCYRDPRAIRGVERVLSVTDWETVFAETGVQYMPINTLYQLAAEDPQRLSEAHHLLGIGCAVNALLSGQARAEVSLASTFQLYNPVSRNWSQPLLQALDLSPALFPEIVSSGTRLGPLRAELAAETGLDGVSVVAGCSHDTAAAVAAVPARGDDWAYLSSGTWSLMGVELPEPVLSEACREFNFTNEIGYGHSVRLLKNIIGLWLVQECRRTWADAGERINYGTLTQLAGAAPAFVSLLDPTDPRFLPPGDMPARIADYCRETGQPVPATPGAFVRCVLESLALLYRRTLEQIEAVTGRSLRTLHVVGGGSRNTLLNRFTAAATGRLVLAGPVEATALGNCLVQALAQGQVETLTQGREIVHRSFPVTVYEPASDPAWDQAYDRFNRLLQD